MERYIGTKIVRAAPEAKVIEHGSPDTVELQPGYKIIYEDGYTSWSPKAVFERCYRLITDAETHLITNME